MKQVFKRGYKAVKEEAERREKEREASQGKLFRIYFPKEVEDDPNYEIPVTFVTEEPLCYREHSVTGIGGKRMTRTCTEDDTCVDCKNGNKPRFVGAYLVIDHRPFDREERDAQGNKTGKKIRVKASAKLLVRGQTDLAQLDRLSTKYGLTSYKWAISKTGSDQNTKWSFDRGNESKLTKKEILAILPENIRDMDFYDIVESQILPQESDEYDNSTDEEVSGRVNSAIRNIDDEEDGEESETPRHRGKSTGKTGGKVPRKPLRKK
jgi:hypothetical protein